MACSSPGHSLVRPLIRPLAEADTPRALPLSAEAGWNQVEGDWRAFIRLGQAWGVEHDGALVASAAVLPYGAFGFTSMVLVTAAWRRRGLATALVEHCIRVLQARGAVPVLDATPAGRTVYGAMGFRDIMPLDRWEGPATGGLTFDAPDPVAIRDAVTLDAVAFGAERGALLGDFCGRAGSLLVSEPGGFALARVGRRAAQLGPVVARTARQAVRLMEAALARLAAGAPVFMDVPARWASISRWLGARGFVRQRPFTRMALGRAGGVPFGDPRRCFAVAGPEFG